MQRVGFQRLAAYCSRATRASARERSRSTPSAMPRIPIASRLGRICDFAKKQPLHRFPDDVDRGQHEQARFDERREILDLAVTVSVIGIGRAVGNSNGEIGDDRGDEIEAGVQRLGEHAQAAGGQRQKNLQRNENNGRTHRAECRQLLCRADVGRGDIGSLEIALPISVIIRRCGNDPGVSVVAGVRQPHGHAAS